VGELGVKGLSHVAVGVSDMDRALVFYRDLVGLRVTLDTVEGGFGGGLVGAKRRRAVYLRAEDGPDAWFIVLDQQLDQEPFGTPPRISQLGTHHFSFWVDDLEEIFERMVAEGFRVIIKPTEADALAYGEAAGSGRLLTAIVKDQDGNPVQLDQRL
jgi:catechol 2,3-dioxygenase-like lactoylglutathione lyase family enzyme